MSVIYDNFPPLTLLLHLPHFVLFHLSCSSQSSLFPTPVSTFSSQTLAADLKRQLDEARNLKSSAGQLPQGGVASRPGTQDGSKEGEEVVLTRTDRSGMVRPLPTREYPDETQGGRRKKQKVWVGMKCLFGKLHVTR